MKNSFGLSLAVLACNGGIGLAAIAQAPPIFTVNSGRAASAVCFETRASGYAGSLMRDGLLIRSGDEFIRMRVDRAAPASCPEGLQPADGRTDAFHRVHYPQIYPGVDLVFYGKGGQLEYDFLLEAGVPPSRIHLLLEGRNARIETDGALRVGPLRWRKPVAYQEIGGKRVLVPAGYVLLANGKIGFDVQGYDPAYPLVIDPVLEYATHVAGHLGDHITAVKVDALGNTYVAGGTAPRHHAEGDPDHDGDAFVAKLDAGGATLWVAHLGGSASDDARGLALDGAGNPVVVGWTASVDFPVSGGAEGPSLRGTGGFLARLDASDGRILQSTLIGLPQGAANAVAVDAAGAIFITGSATAPAGGDADAFVMKWTADGARVEYLRFLGGDGVDSGNAIAVDGAGLAYVAGAAASANFPTQGELQSFGGVADCFVTRLDPSGQVEYATFLGGSAADRCAAIAVDQDGWAYVAGETSSPDFPVQAAPQGVWGGQRDAFVARLNPSGSALVYSTYLGGTADDLAAAIVIDGDRNAHVTGSTEGHFPGLSDVSGTDRSRISFVAGIGPDGGPLLYTTEVATGSADFAQAIARDSSGALYVGGDRRGDSAVAGGFLAKISGKASGEIRREAREAENHAPAAPSLNPVLSPASLAPTLTWSPAAGAVSYAVYVDTNPNPGAYITRNVASGQTSVIIGNLSPNQTYYWQVYALDANGGVAASPVGSFTTVRSDTPALHPYGFLPIQGPEQTIGVHFQHPSGVDAFQRLYILVGPTLQLSQACYLSYDVAANQAYLLNDAANNWGSPATPGVGGATLQNSQCVIDVSRMAIGRTSGEIEVFVPVRRKTSFYGRKEIYLYATTVGGGSVDWRYLNTWIDWPLLGPVVPSSGLGTSVSYSITYPFRPDQVTGLFVLINAGLDPRNACYLSATTGGVFSLLQDDGVNWWSPVVAGSATSFQNSQCVLDLRTTSVSIDSSGITLHLPLTFKGSFSGIRRVFLMARTPDRGDTDWQFAAVWTVGASYGPPTAGPVSPNSGSGAAQRFSVTYTNPGGAAALNGVFLLMNSPWNPVNACAVYYLPATSQFHVLDDTGNSWGGGSVAGSGTLRNSQCVLNLANSSATTNGTTLTLNVDLQFLASFAGVRQMYVLARSPSGDTGWQYGGQWTVPAAASLSVGPTTSAPRAEKTAFTMNYTNPAGANQLTGAFFLMNSDVSAVGGCVVRYAPQTNSLYLLNDAGTDWGLPLNFGDGVRSNRQCTLHGSASSVSISGPVLTLRLGLTFEAGFRGPKQVYLLAQSPLMETAWQPTLTYEVETPIGPVIPDAGSGGRQVFTAQYWHPQGGTAYNSVFFRIASSDLASNSCIVYYSRVGGAFFLMNDAGSSYGSGGIAGTAGYLENSQCRLDLAQTSATVDGRLLSVKYALEFKGAFAGPKKLYLMGQAPNVSSVFWTEAGTWTVYGATISAGSLTPATGQGSTQAFSAKYTDPSGPSALTGAFLMLRSTASVANACAVYYSPSQQLFFLLNDAGSDWGLGMHAGAGVLQNSQCQLDLTKSTAVADSSSVTVTFGLAFRAAFAGTKDIFLLARSAGADTGWVQAGNWTIPPGVGGGMITPDGATGNRQVFSIVYTPPSGAQIQGGFFLMNSTLKAPDGCVVYYAPALGRLFLLNDAASSWGDGGVPGTAGVLENSQCSLHLGTSSANVISYALNLQLDLAFKTPFRGPKSMYLLLRTATDEFGWYESGNWIVP